MSAAIRPPQWTDLALCTEIPGDVFFPEAGQPAGPATAVCRSCEVRLQCLDAAVQRPGTMGVWGGFSERVLRRVARQHAAGKSLEDIIAADDARHYARIEARAARGTYTDRRLAAERETRRVKREAAEQQQEGKAAA